MNSGSMLFLAILISLLSAIANGRSAYALENRPVASNVLVGRNANANGAGRSNASPLQHSSLRKLQEDGLDVFSAPSDTEILTEAVETEIEAVEERLQDASTVSPSDQEALAESLEELTEVVKEVVEEPEDTTTPAVTTTEASAGVKVTTTRASISAKETTTEATEERFGFTTEVPPATTEEVSGNTTPSPSSDDLIGSITNPGPTPNPSSTESAPSPTPDPTEYSSESGSEEDKGEPQIWNQEGTVSPMPVTVSPTPVPPADEVGPGHWEYRTSAPTPDETRATPVPTPNWEEETYSPTATGNEFNWGNNPWGSFEMGPTNKPTEKPTALYVPKSEAEDPLYEEEEPDTPAFTEDGVPYHGLGGKVGAYLDQVESPQEMEKDKNIQIVAGVLGSLFLILLLVTAHLVMNHPDGLCAGCCRLTLKVICCFTRTLCLPCRAICCKGSDQAAGRRTHAPMRGAVGFPTDLELA